MRKLGFLFLLVFTFSFCKNEKPKPVIPNISTPQIDNSLIAPTDAFIKKYEGKIGNKYPIELVLVNWSNGNLSGYYSYTDQVKKGNKDSKKIELSGELHLNESFIIDEYYEDDFTGKFTGSLSELTTINGTWSNADSSKSMTYTLKEVTEIDKTGWSGDWYRNNAQSPGLLILGNKTATTIDFGLEVFNGGHSGFLEGTAKLNGGIATFENHIFGEEEKCFLVFQKHDSLILIDQKSSNWSCGFGMRAHADGKFESELKNEKIVLSYEGDNNIFTNKEQHDIFQELVGEEYESFAFNMQNVTTISEHPKDNLNAFVTIGNVTGLSTSNEAIIMRNDKNQIWAAVIVFDEFLDKFQVKYFTNDESRKEKIPNTIDEWREGFREYDVVF